MSENYLTLKANGQHTIDIKKSQFICSLARISTKEEAEAFIEATRKANPKANHNCFAYLLGEHDDVQRESDDGEPSGTAGVPILEVLKMTDLHNVCAVVTRYFGGIKLGAGGLIRAYSNATSRGIEAVGVVKRVLQTDLALTVSYANFDKLNYYLQQNTVSVLDTTYAENVTVQIAVDVPDVEATQTAVTNLLAGQVTFAVGEDHYHDVDVPLYRNDHPNAD
ncbi:YigZ family protein [Secundilactobacillus similis]|uniref:YigZ family protein n=1 Tax=Secundilactobacillus similis DSM 23365 = JCM 2765 TaxID=1423804 RepID=A0A0R2EY10_9LACO|nr:YigZ family protein [Secundilactobacillus similis]KRN16900.1 hypothetical protein FD14_GL002693 [Secundilactobacillus similis DSM 23365 = JCM 2765]